MITLVILDLEFMVHHLSAATRFIHSRSSLLLLDFRGFTHVLLISSLSV